MHVRLLFSLSLALAVFISPKFSVAGSGGPMAPTADHMGLAPGHDKPPMANPTLAQAFAAVFGRSTPATRVVSRASNPPCCRTVALTVTPGDLVDLGSGRYALLSLETNPLGSHVEPGAISIAYLDHQGRDWRVEHVWNEFAWTGDSGTPADSMQDLTTSGAPPIVFALRQGVWQGEEITTAWALVLDRKPRMAGDFNAGGEVDADNGCDFSTCGAWAYIAGIDRPFAAGALFSVAYGGWQEAPGVHHPTPFAAVTNYVERGGALVAVPPVSLPGRNL